MYHFSKNYGAN